MNSVLVLPAGRLAGAALSLLRETAGKPIVDHSLRSFFFARLTARHEGLLTEAAYDEDLLFAATVMHDLGLGTLAAGKARFEVEGADLAAGLLAGHEVPDGDTGRVWEAIALHSSPGLADRMGLPTYLTHKGVFTDGGRFAELSPDLQEPVRVAFPRPAGDRSPQDVIVQGPPSPGWLGFHPGT